MPRRIPGYEGSYEITEEGKIVSYKHCKTGRLLGEGMSGEYLNTCLSMNGVHKTKTIHRLQALATYGYSDLDVNHIDGNKLNNHCTNVEYCTQSQNQIHAFRNGLQKKQFGKEHWHSKEVKQFDLDGNLIKVFESVNMASRELNLYAGSIHNTIRGKTQILHGFRFTY